MSIARWFKMFEYCGLSLILWSIQLISGRLKSPASIQYSNILNQRAIDMSKDNCLHQMTDEPSRHDNILDLVMTTNQDLVNDLQIEPGMSEHEIVIANFNIGAQRQRRPERTVLT
jgi:hypothetical protein